MSKGVSRKSENSAEPVSALASQLLWLLWVGLWPGFAMRHCAIGKETERRTFRPRPLPDRFVPRLSTDSLSICAVRLRSNQSPKAIIKSGHVERMTNYWKWPVQQLSEARDVHRIGQPVVREQDIMNC
jgi:hypothetical protein